jgi:glyoxylase-like metal-dependent hydrolase (beta-lactamase superfamily II)
MSARAPVEVAPGVHRVSVPLPFPPHEVAAWLLEGPDGHTLVDTGMDTPGARGALRDGAERLGVSPESLTRVVLTHAHIDHFGLASRVRAWSGATVWMHEREARLVQDFVHGWPRDRTSGVEHFMRFGAPEPVARQFIAATDRIHELYEDFRPDAVLTGDRGEVPGTGGWEFIHTPGHSPGHITLYHPVRRVLIAGDHVLPRISPNIGADLYAPNPLTAYLTSLRRLRALPVDLVLPSHGEPFEGWEERIDDLIEHHEDRSREMLEVMRPSATAYEITLRVFDELPPDSRLHAIRETMAHLAHLEHEGRASRDGGNPDRWTPLEG